LHIIICIEKISIDTESSVEGKVVAILKIVINEIFVVINEIFAVRIDHSVDKVVIESELGVILKKTLYLYVRLAGCIWKKNIISTLTDFYLCKFENV